MAPAVAAETDGIAQKREASGREGNFSTGSVGLSESSGPEVPL